MKTKNYLLVLRFLLIILFSNQLFGNGLMNDSEIELTKNAKGNFIMGIKSSNPGLCRSCIYFVGKYKIEEAVEVLIEKVRKELDPNIRILIAISLYQIGDKEGLYELEKMVLNDPDLYVREVCRNIYNVFISNEFIANY